MKKILLILSCVFIYGCTLIAPINVANPKLYQINISNVPRDCISKNILVLKVSDMKVNKPFNTQQMIYSLSNNILDAYADSRWAANPNDMIINNLIEYLNNQCKYANVVDGNLMVKADYQLNTELLRLSLDRRNNKSYVNLMISADLINLKSSTIVKHKLFNLQRQSEFNPQSMVDVTNQLNQEFVMQLFHWL